MPKKRSEKRTKSDYQYLAEYIVNASSPEYKQLRHQITSLKDAVYVIQLVGGVGTDDCKATLLSVIAELEAKADSILHPAP